MAQSVCVHTKLLSGDVGITLQKAELVTCAVMYLYMIQHHTWEDWSSSSTFYSI